MLHQSFFPITLLSLIAGGDHLSMCARIVCASLLVAV